MTAGFSTQHIFFLTVLHLKEQTLRLIENSTINLFANHLIDLWSDFSRYLNYGRWN